MTPSEAQELREQISKEIKYRVRQEYKKYHNDLTFKWNGKGYWAEQIVSKLTDTLMSGLEAHTNAAKLALLDEVEAKLRSATAKNNNGTILYLPSGEIAISNPMAMLIIQALRTKITTKEVSDGQ